MQSYTTLSGARSGRGVFESGTMQAESVLLLGRILLGAIFVVSGCGKLMGLSAFAASLQRNGVQAPRVLAVVGACIGFFGGLAVALGLRARLAALLMIVFVVVATLISHRFWEIESAQRTMQRVNFMKNLAIVGGFLLLSCVGGGRISVDGAFARRLA